MQPGFKRLLKRFEKREKNIDPKELFEDIKVMETEAPEIADIMKRMIAAEVNEIKRQKESQLDSSGLQNVE